MSQQNIEQFHSDLTHIRRIQNVKFGLKHSPFAATLLVSCLLGGALAYGVLALVAGIYSNAGLMQGGGMIGEPPLMMFTFMMTCAILFFLGPILMPIQILLVAGLLAIVSAVLFVIKKAVFLVRKGFDRPLTFERPFRIIRQVRMA